MKKIITDNQIAQVVKKIKRNKKRISLCHGVFDIFHFGHLKHFQIAKSYSDILIVKLYSPTIMGLFQQTVPLKGSILRFPPPTTSGKT